MTLVLSKVDSLLCLVSSGSNRVCWVLGLLRFSMVRRLANRTLVEAEAHAVARSALAGWYRRGFVAADSAIPKLQIETNLKIVSSIPGWQEAKGVRNGYVMLDMHFSGRLKPIVITLEYEERHRGSGTWMRGGLTYRQLHQQIRQALELEPKVSMRLRCHRPWCRYMLGMPIPEQSALPSHDGQCRHLLGTTLFCYLYIHLTTEG